MKKEEDTKKTGQPPANPVVFKTLLVKFKFNLVAYDANHTRDIKIHQNSRVALVSRRALTYTIWASGVGYFIIIPVEHQRVSAIPQLPKLVSYPQQRAERSRGLKTIM